jgi:hypothetical protein
LACDSTARQCFQNAPGNGCGCLNNEFGCFFTSSCSNEVLHIFERTCELTQDNLADQGVKCSLDCPAPPSSNTACVHTLDCCFDTAVKCAKSSGKTLCECAADEQACYLSSSSPCGSDFLEDFKSECENTKLVLAYSGYNCGFQCNVVNGTSKCDTASGGMLMASGWLIVMLVIALL